MSSKAILSSRKALSFFGFMAASICLTGCQDTRPMLVPTAPPSLRTARPLPGNVTVMLPNDLRPSVERDGSSPGLEYIIYLVFIIIDAERGTYVTYDSQFQPPVQHSIEFGKSPVVPAGVGEAVVSYIKSSGLFQNVSRLGPPGGKGEWDLATTPSRPVQVLPDPKSAADLNGSEQEAENLQLRGEATPIPAFSTDWLLRVHILHFYSSQFSTRVSMTVATGENSTATSTKTTGYAPFGNAVLECELYHKVNGQVVKAWDDTVRGTAIGPSSPGGYDSLLTLQALTNALNQMVSDLDADSVRILADDTRQNKMPVASAVRIKETLKVAP